MDLSILIPSVVGLVISVPLLVLGLKMVLANRLLTFRQVKPKPLPKPIQPKPLETPMANGFLEIAKKHQVFMEEQKS